MKRVVIAMSGGVDSSVTAALMQEQGYECIGMHVHMWEESTAKEGLATPKANKCCSLNGLDDARWVCQKLDIPFYVMNAEREFKEQVVDYFLKGYAQGETPNPCIECNRKIKFGQLLDRAEELEAEFLASGHYAQNSWNEASGKFELGMAADRGKDQSYFLYTLTQAKLRRILFPLGNMLKKDVYEKAKELGLVRVVQKPQSQGLCFFVEGSPQFFLQRYLPQESIAPGPIVTLAGKEIGKHRGLAFYTIGQRHGLGIGGIAGEPEGAPWYVVRIERGENRLVVGREHDVESFQFSCENVHFVSGKKLGARMAVTVRIRHRGSLIPAMISLRDGKVFVETKTPMMAVSPGQSAVFYDGEKVLGGGMIERASHEEGRVQTAHRSHGVAIEAARRASQIADASKV